MIFSSSDFTVDQLSLGVNTEKSFAPLPPDQSVGIKAWVRTTEYHRSSKLQAIEALLHSPAAPSGTQHSGQIEKGRPQVGLHLHPRETLGPPPLFRSGPHAGDHPRLAMVAAGDTKQIA